MKRTGLAAVVVVALVALLWFNFRTPAAEFAHVDVTKTTAASKRDTVPAPTPRRRAAEADLDEADAGPAPWEILVLGARDAPLGGVTAKAVGDERTGRLRTTAADGLVTLQRVAGQTSLDVDLGGTAPARRVTLTQARTIVRVPDALPLVVRLVDGETGAAISGGAVKIDGRDVPFDPDHDGFRLGATSVRRGASVNLDVDVAAPEGYVGFRGPIRSLVGTFTDATELTILLWPELDLTADVRPLGVSEQRTASIVDARIAGRTREFTTAASDGAGHIAIRGVPFVRNSRVRVLASRPGRTGSGEATLGPTVGAPIVLPIALAELPPIGTPLTFISVTGDVGSHRFYKLPIGDATVVVSVMRSDGRAAADVPISLTNWPAWRLDDRTDVDGRVTFPGIAAGEYDVVVYGEGITAADRKVVAAPGATTTVSIRPATGLASTITVLDESNRPLPCAAVSIVGDTHVQDEGGVQQLLIRADAYGRCRLHGLPVGKATAHVQWESRSGNVEFTAGEDATIVLRARTE